MSFYKKKLLRIKIRKATALFILFTILNQMFAPMVAYALTAGPTSPEATSFEPVDTTDMVNMLTGKFTYSLPLLEVPGPEGGYPLSLAYHAGIQPNEEASWVGLGWSLNPGAIARNVNGFADDYKDISASNRSYWSGGNRSTFGISVGLPVGVSFGLSFAQDTYQGFGVGASIGYGIRIGTYTGLSGSVGIGPYGGVDASLNLGASTAKSGSAAIGLGGSVGVSTNFQSVNANAGGGISYSNSSPNQGSFSLLGASISTSGGGAHTTVGGGSISVYNANAGRIQTRSSGFGFTLPLGLFSIGVGYNYTRYWSDETATILTNGSLYIPQTVGDQSYLDSRTFDIYRVPDPANNNIADYPDPDNVQGGTFPDFDNYSVTAQGLGGNMRPYIYQSKLFNNNQNDIVQSNGIPVTGMSAATGVQFRFIGDFSNAYTQSTPNMDKGNLSFTFSNPVYGNNDSNYGYNASTNQLAGSRNIVWFTNDQINSTQAKNAGFIDVPVGNGGFNRPGTPGALRSDAGQQIGGFMITNESGVTYHYALPAYEYSQYMQTSNPGANSYTEDNKPTSYAYTWYLTAITGPDFVDRNKNGLADDGDWGYWVNFDYGRWADGYVWRNPADGVHKEVDPNYQSYSTGIKEIYYLDAIRTRTHTAIFEKEMRADAKGVTRAVQNGPSPGFIPDRTTICSYSPNGGSSARTVTRKNYPVASLRLKEILLFKNDQLNVSVNALRASSTDYEQAFTFGDGVPQCTLQTFKVHNGKNVIDAFDIAANAGIANNCLRRIIFNHDYSLCSGSSGVPNSFDPGGYLTYNTTPIVPPGVYMGKLTLLSVDLQGKGGASMTPPIQFQYDLDPTDPSNQDVASMTSGVNNLQGTLSIGSANKFKPGDILKLTNNDGTYYCTLLSSQDNRNFNVLYLNTAPAQSNGMLAVRTKNPPYNKDAYDIWGMYKSDYIPTSGNENQARATTTVSNQATDAWSLRAIQTSVGSMVRVNYEGNTYRRPILNGKPWVVVDGGSFDKNNNTITVNVPNNLGADISRLYPVGSKVDAVFLYKRTINATYHGTNRVYYDYKAMGLSAYSPTVKSLSGNTLQITVSPNYFTDMISNPVITGSPVPGLETIVSVVGVQLTGNLKTPEYLGSVGGGIRVKELSIDDQDGSIKKTAYDYNVPDYTANARVSSGITSYEPNLLDTDNLNAYLSSSVQIQADAIKSYHRILYQGIGNILALSRFAPAPGVMYEYVTASDFSVLPDGTTVPVEGKVVYQYRVFNSGMLGISQLQYDKTSTQSSKNVVLKDYTSQVGNLLRTITYDVNNNKLTEVRNQYLNDDIVNNGFDYQVHNYDGRLAAYNNQGRIIERYADGRHVNSTGIYELTMSTIDEVPIIGLGTTKIDYVNGTTVSQKNLGFDFYSGAVTQSLTTDSYGNRFKNEITPAYRVYPALGVRTGGSSADPHKNMLTQEAANYTFAVDQNNNPTDVVSAAAQTWSNLVPVTDPDENAVTDGSQSNIWRMERSLSWMPSGSSANNLTPYSSFINYFATGGSSNASWKKTSQITQYNVYSAALEGNDINNNYAATRMGYNSSKVLFTGGAAKYNEIAYAGAEDAPLSNGNFSNNISKGAGTIVVDSTKAHTGTNSLLVTAGTNGFTYSVPVGKLNSAQNYHVSVWVRPSAGSSFNQAQLYYTANGSTVTPTQTYSKTAANWCLLEMIVPSTAVTGTTLVVGCKNAAAVSMYFDDFRFQPVSASATAYVYDNKSGELTYILDNNNMFTRYQYDAIGRLVRVYKEVLGKTNTPVIKGISYNYARMPGVCAIPPVNPPPTSSTGAGSFVTPDPMDSEWKMEAPPGYTLAEDDGTIINANKKAGLNAGRFAYFSTAGITNPLTFVNGTLSFSAKGTGTIEVQLIATSNNSIQARKTFTLTPTFQNYTWAISNLYPKTEMVAAILVNGGNSSLQASVQFQNNFNLNLNQLGLGSTYTRFRADATSMIGNAERDWYGWSDQYNAPRKKYLQHSAYARMRFQTTATQIAIEYVRDFYDKRVVNLFSLTQVRNQKAWDANGNVVSGTNAVNTYTRVTGGQTYTISGLLTTNPTIVWFSNGSPLGPPAVMTNSGTPQAPVYQVVAPAGATNLGLLIQNGNDKYKVYLNCMIQQGAIGTVTPFDGTIPSPFTAFSGYTPSHISGPAIFINGSLYKYYQVEGNDVAKVIQFVTDALPAGNKTVEIMMPGQGTTLPADPHVRRSGTYLRAVYFPGATGTTVFPSSTVAAGSIVYIHDSILSGFNISSDAQNNVWMMKLQRDPAYGFTGDVFSEGYAGRILGTDIGTPALTAAFAKKLASFGVDKYWFQIGVNDFGFNTSLPLFYVQYKSLIEQLKLLRPNAKMYIQSTGPESFEGSNGETMADDGLTTTGPTANDFRDVQRALATSHAYCEYVDFEGLFPPTDANLSDGIHPTDAGNVLYANGVKNKSTLLGTVLPVTPLAFYRTSTRNMVQSVPGIYTITATGGKAPYLFTGISGNLPDGLTFNNDGTLTGTPSVGGSFSLTVNVIDANNNSIRQTFPINVDLLPPVGVGPQHIMNAQVNTPYSQTFKGYYGYGPYIFSITSGTIPPGMTFDGSSGILSGTTTTVGTYKFTLTATDHYGFQGSADYTLVTGTTPVNGLTDNFTVTASVDASNHLWVTGHLNDIYSETLYGFISSFFTPADGGEIFLGGKNVTMDVGLRDGVPVDMGAMGLRPGTFSVRMLNNGIAPTTIDNVGIGYNTTTIQTLTTGNPSPTAQLSVSATINSQGHLIVFTSLPFAASTIIYSTLGAGITQNSKATYMPGPSAGVNISPGSLTSPAVDFGLVPASTGSVAVRIFNGGVTPTADKGYVLTFNPTTDYTLTMPPPF